MQDGPFLWKLHCWSTNRGILPIMNDHTHAIESIALALESMHMGGFLYIIVINNSFVCVYAIKIHHFEQLKFSRQSGKKLWGTQICTLPLYVILTLHQQFNEEFVLVFCMWSWWEKKYFLIFYCILISNYSKFIPFNILTFYCVYSHCLQLHNMIPCTISIKAVHHGWISKNSKQLNMSASTCVGFAIDRYIAECSACFESHSGMIG